jgi:hypothetical protein
MAYMGTSARIPLGASGIISDAAPTELPVNALTQAKNVTLVNGTVQKSPGGRRLNTVPLPAGGVAAVDWHPDEITQQTVVACSNGEIYFDTGPGDFNLLVPIATGLTNLTPNSMFVTGGNETGGREKKLFFFSFGENQLKVLAPSVSGDFRDIASPAADWTIGKYPKVGVIHRNSLWAFAGQISYASDSGDHENFLTNTQVNPIFPGEGGDIRGAYVFKGKLFCFKDGGFVYALNDDAADTSDWYWQKLANNFGLAAPNAVCEVLDDMIAGNTSGTATSYTATNALGDVESADIFRAAAAENYLRENFHPGGIPFQHCIYYAAKKLFYMTYRSAYYTYNNMMIEIDFSRSNIPPRVLPQIKGSPQCLFLRKDLNGVERPLYVDKDGYVVFMDSENRLEGGSAFEGRFQTVNFDMSHLDPGFAGVNKHWDWLKVEYRPEGNWNLSCDYYVDGKFIETITFPMIQYQDPQLDVFLLDTSRLAQQNTETFRRPLTTTGRTITFNFYNSGANQSFQVSAIVIGFRPSGEQAQRAT